MANATARVPSASTPWGDDGIKRVPAASAVTYYSGAMVALNASGNVVKCDDTAGLTFDGLNANTARLTINSDDTVATMILDQSKQMSVERPWRISMDISTTVTGANIGTAVYALYDNTVALTTSNSILVGWIDQIIDDTGSGGTRVLIKPAYAPLTNLAVSSNTLTFTGSTGANTIVMPDNLAAALVVKQGSNAYLTFDTTDTTGEYVQFDKKALFPDSVKCEFGTGEDITVTFDGTDLLVAQAAPDTIVKWGVSGAGINHIFYGDTATYNLTWDQSNDQLLFNDNAVLAIGTGAGAKGDIQFSWDATKMLVAQLTANSAIEWGVDGAGIDMKFYGDTASAYCLWDQSADQLILGGVATVSGLRVATGGATAITTTRAVTKADSGGVFTVGQGSAYTITCATPGGAGERYLFQLVSAGANDVSLVATGCTFEGTITIDSATIPATGSTLKFASGASVLGDSIELISTSATKFLVRAIASGAGGITIT